MPVPLVGMVEFSVGKENDVAELGGTPEPPGWDVPLPVGNEKDIAPELGGAPVPLDWAVEFPVGKENDVSAELGERVPMGFPVELSVGKEKDVAPEL